MNLTLLFLVKIIIVGIISCLAMDLWQQVLKKISGIPSSNWRIVGRWFLMIFSAKKIFNPTITEELPLKNENRIGWLVHYSVAVIYVLFYWVLMTQTDLLAPTVLDGLMFGAISVVVPWFFFMPCLGNGFLATKSPNPTLSCTVALASHSILGLTIGFMFSVLN